MLQVCTCKAKTSLLPPIRLPFQSFFNGGNIGKLSIAGTVNDLAMMGARPKYLNCSFMIEEGFEYDKLEQIVISMRDECKSGVKICRGR